MRILVIILAALCVSLNVHAQYVYTIKADSVKITNCDSAELILENHTQGVPGFLFNTGNGRTIFKRGLQQLGNGSFVIGADTLKSWIQGGNSFGTTGVLGTLDNNHLDFYTNDSSRVRVTNTGNLLVGSTTDNGNKLQVTGSGMFTGTLNMRITPDNTDSRYYMTMENGDLIGANGRNMFFQLASQQNSYNFTFGYQLPLGIARQPTIALAGPGVIGQNLAITSPSNYYDLANVQNIGLDGSPLNIYGGGYNGQAGVVITRNPRSTIMTDPLLSVMESDTTVFQTLKNGNVGINTSTPQFPLDVNGASNFGSTTYFRGLLNYVTNGFIDMRAASAQFNFPGDGSVGLSTGSVTANRRLTVDTAGRVGIGIINPTAQLHTTGSVRFAGLTQDSTQTEVLVSDPNGNLFFRSTASLAADEPVRSSLAVNGTIKSNKIIISPDDWADYVFDSTYHLAQLAEVESYIRREHHLPGIPSAAAVQKDSLDVGASQAALLKKIEELTLYTIDQNKRLDEQSKEIEQLKAKLEILIDKQGSNTHQ